MINKRQAFSSGNSTIQSNNSSSNRMSGNFHSSQKNDAPSEENSVGGDFWIGVAPLLDMAGTARILACKAANISSAMLAHRRKSSALPSIGCGGIHFPPPSSYCGKKSSGASSILLTNPKWQQYELHHHPSTSMQHQSQLSNAPSSHSAIASAATRRQTARESVAILAESWGVFAVDPNAASAKEEITGN
uniref:Uncharacterized protein n=1 Tax=Meloidogyne javanica TaxID=6303 RepID=A0A915MEM2_MELJA